MTKAPTGREFPNWFYEKCLRDEILKNPRALTEYLTGWRETALSALSLYQAHVKYALTVMLSLSAVAGGIFPIVKATEASANIVRNIEIVAGTLLILASCFGFVCLWIITRYHNFWVATLLHTAQVHYQARLGTYYWFTRMTDFLKEEYKKNPEISKKQFIMRRTLNPKDSHLWYLIITLIMSAAYLVFAIWILFWAPFSKG